MKIRKIIAGGLSILLAVGAISLAPVNGMVTYAATPPNIASQGAALYNANTGEFLYEKDGNKQFFPASITKIMTTLLALEQADLDDTVVFSKSATTNLESGATNLGVVEGDRISVRDALYGTMLASANEVANGLAEHVGGSIPGFANMMNARAREIGAKNTNFVNPSGLNNQNHKTTAKDMALIAAEAFRNPNFRAIASTRYYTFPATKGKPATSIAMHHKMIQTNDNRYYPGVIGGKTGYTKSAGNTLVTCAERNGVRLVVVILKSQGTHYTDTRALLDYGFEIASTGGVDIASKDVSVKKSITGAAVQAAKKEVVARTESAQQVQVTNADSAKVDAAPKSIATSDVRAENYGPGMAPDIGWKESNGSWFYVKSDRTSARAEVLNINGKKYWFDADGRMAKGWRQDTSGSWYFMEDSGAMNSSGWLKYNGLWYYLGSDGKMLTNTTTPDGYTINSDGVWVS